MFGLLVCFTINYEDIELWISTLLRYLNHPERFQRQLKPKLHPTQLRRNFQRATQVTVFHKSPQVILNRVMNLQYRVRICCHLSVSISRKCFFTLLSINKVHHSLKLRFGIIEQQRIFKVHQISPATFRKLNKLPDIILVSEPHAKRRNIVFCTASVSCGPECPHVITDDFACLSKTHQLSLFSMSLSLMKHFIKNRASQINRH